MVFLKAPLRKKAKLLKMNKIPRNTLLSFIFLLLLPTFAWAQIEIEGKIEGNPVGEKVYLSSYFGERLSLVDSATLNPEGDFIMNLPKHQHNGLYRMDLGEGRFFDFIINDEKKIRLTTDYNAPIEMLQVQKSRENKAFYHFIKEENRIESAIALLFPLLSEYPLDDPFFPEIARRYESLQIEKDSIINKLSKDNPGTFAAKLIQMRKSPYLEAWLPRREKLNKLKNEFFYGLTFSDTSLLYSNAYTSKAIEYMSFYSNPDFNFEEIQVAFIGAVDKIMAKAGEDPKVYNQVLNYLVGGFEQYHFDEVLAHIATNWPEDGTCKNEDESTLAKRLENYKKLANGMPAPGFEFTDEAGQKHTLSDIKSKKTALVFWASWCPHCRQIMPELKKLYGDFDRDELEIISISIDTSRAEWQQAIKTIDAGWLNSCDEKGWDGKAATLYNIYATPSLFLLDEDKNIISKPMTVSELRTKLEE